MIRPYLLSITALLFLAGCNPPASVVSPAPEPTDTPGEDDIDNGWKVEFGQVLELDDSIDPNAPLPASYTVTARPKCDSTSENCNFSRLGLNHRFYFSNASSPKDYFYPGSIIEVNNETSGTDGHGIIFYATSDGGLTGNALRELRITGDNNTVLFEQDTMLHTLTIGHPDELGTSSENFTRATPQTVVRVATEADLCARQPQPVDATVLCTGDGSEGLDHLGSVQVNTVTINSHNTALDLSRYDGHQLTHPLAGKINPDSADIHQLDISSSDNIVYLCGLSVNHINVSGTNNTIYVDNPSSWVVSGSHQVLSCP